MDQSVSITIENHTQLKLKPSTVDKNENQFSGRNQTYAFAMPVQDVALKMGLHNQSKSHFTTYFWCATIPKGFNEQRVFCHVG